MTYLRVFSAPAIVLIANIILFSGVAWNRSGTPSAEISFSQCEFHAFGNSAGNKRLTRTLNFIPQIDRLDQKLLEEFRYPREAEKGDRHFPKPAWVVIEHDGAAWQDYLEKNRKRKYFHEPSLKLIIVDAGKDAEPLRQRYSDRSRYIIVPGVVERRVNGRTAADNAQDKIATVVARILDNDISITSNFRSEIFGINQTARKRHHNTRGNHRKKNACQPTHNIMVKWGQRYEPWLDRVAPLSPS